VGVGQTILRGPLWIHCAAQSMLRASPGWPSVPGHPPNACVRPLEAAGKPFCAFAVLRRTESRWFADPWQTPLVACDEPLFFTLREI